MAPKLKSIETGQDTVRYATSHKKVKSVRWSGDHCTFEGPDGRMTAANSKYEYPPYVRKKIIAQLIAIGLGIFIVVLVF